MSELIGPQPTDRARILSKVSTDDPKKCWDWCAGMFPNGYGQFKLKGRTIGAHRASYQIFTGEIPPGLVVRHTCDNKKCVNPAHLITGTPKQNTADYYARACPKPRSGARHPNAVLTELQVAEIRARLAGVRGEQKALALEYGVNFRTIWNIKSGIRWRPVSQQLHQ